MRSPSQRCEESRLMDHGYKFMECGEVDSMPVRLTSQCQRERLSHFETPFYSVYSRYNIDRRRY